MSDVLQDAETEEFLKTAWAAATTHRRREIGHAITEFIRANPDDMIATYWGFDPDEEQETDWEDIDFDPDLEDEVDDLREKVAQLEEELAELKKT